MICEMKYLAFDKGDKMGGFVRLWLAPAPEAYGLQLNRDNESISRFHNDGYRPNIINGYLQNLPDVDFNLVYIQPGSLRFTEIFAQAQDSETFQVNIEALYPKTEIEKSDPLKDLAGQKLIALILDSNGMFRMIGVNTGQYLKLQLEIPEQASEEDLNAIKIILSGSFTDYAPYVAAPLLG
jgi:hypothetical protein